LASVTVENLADSSKTILFTNRRRG